nr:hypothetical protein MarFTME_361 [Marseillevirus futianmevirus]
MSLKITSPFICNSFLPARRSLTKRRGKKTGPWYFAKKRCLCGRAKSSQRYRKKKKSSNKESPKFLKIFCE